MSYLWIRFHRTCPCYFAASTAAHTHGLMQNLYVNEMKRIKAQHASTSHSGKALKDSDDERSSQRQNLQKYIPWSIL